ncbi:MAG TPA: hypothetical protein VN618_07490 [Solirubrobacteraceae bacterium]|nr:hypothetical protein [Solirubrobacteraceae bacterium]
MTSAISKLLRLASVSICLIVAVSFLLFALNQTSTASGQQQEILNPKTPAVQGPAGSATGAAPAPNGFRQGVDEVAEALTSPVAGVSSSEWTDRTLRLLFALLVYGFALGYLARMLRVRA